MCELPEVTVNVKVPIIVNKLLSHLTLIQQWKHSTIMCSEYFLIVKKNVLVIISIESLLQFVFHKWVSITQYC